MLLTAAQLRETDWVWFWFNIGHHLLQEPLQFWKLLCRTSWSRPRSLAPKRSINCGSQWFTGSMSTWSNPVFLHISHFPPVVSQAALTGNTSLCNLPWQGENISIKWRLPRQTSLVLDNLSDWAVFLSARLCPHFISLSVFYAFFSPPSDQYFCFSQIKCTVYLNLLDLTLSQELGPFHPAASARGCIWDRLKIDVLFCNCLPFSDSCVTSCAICLSPQIYSARPCRWMSGGFLRQPGTISPVKRWDQTDTYPSLRFIWLGADECHLLSGFNLVRRFSLLKSADVKKIRNPRGPIILRLGKAALLRPVE